MRYDLMGVSEIAAMLGVSTQRVSQLSSSSDFPEPVVVLIAGRFWERSDIVAWARATGRIAD